MKTILGRMGRRLFAGVLISGVMLGSLLQSAQGQSQVFSGTGTTTASSNVSWYATRGAPATDRMARVHYLDVTGDTPASVVKFYTVGTAVNITNATVGAGTNWVGVTNLPGGITNGVCVLEFIQKQVCQRLTVASNTANKIYFNEPLMTNGVRNDKLYVASVAGQFILGNTSRVFQTQASGTGLWYGQAGKPLLMEATGAGTNTVRLGAVAGDWMR